MPATNYLFDTRELKFIVKEWLDTERLLSCDEYKDYYGVDDIDAFIDVAYKIAKDVVAPANGDADTIGVKFEDGKVYIPESMKKAYATVCERQRLITRKKDMFPVCLAYAKMKSLLQHPPP